MLEAFSLRDEIPGSRNLAQQPRKRTQGTTRRVRLRITQRNIHLVNLRLGEVIGSLSKHRVEEIHHTKGTSHKREDATTVEVDLSANTRMRENIMKSHLAQRKLAVVRVRAKVLQCMQSLAHAAQRLSEILLISLAPRTCIDASVVDAARQAVLDVGGACIPVATLVGDVVLHPGMWVDIELNLAHGRTEALVILASIHVIGVVFGVARVHKCQRHSLPAKR